MKRYRLLGAALLIMSLVLVGYAAAIQQASFKAPVHITRPQPSTPAVQFSPSSITLDDLNIGAGETKTWELSDANGTISITVNVDLATITFYNVYNTSLIVEMVSAITITNSNYTISLTLYNKTHADIPLPRGNYIMYLNEIRLTAGNQTADTEVSVVAEAP